MGGVDASSQVVDVAEPPPTPALRFASARPSQPQAGGGWRADIVSDRRRGRSMTRADPPTSRARHLRREATPQERRLWTALRQVEWPSGGHFRRQVPIGPYYADFAHHGLKIVVELDGGQHSTDEGVGRDERRTAALEAAGYRVLRFWNAEVMDNFDGVVETIYAHALESPPTPARAPRDSALPTASGGRGGVDRRVLLGAAAFLGVASALPREARAQEKEAHGLSIFGDLKYGPAFPHFDYVRPDAPKGGAVSLQITSSTGNQTWDTFNTLNIHVLKGDGAAGMTSTFDSLMVRALDEPDAMYGLVARAVRVSQDGRSYRFSLRPEARFHDGSRLTAHDVAFTIGLLKEKGHPNFSQALRLVEAAVAEADDVVRIDFARDRARDLPLYVAGLPIFSKAYWSGREFEAATLESPLGSGPYRVARFESGRFIAFERVKDYWAAKLPVNVGQANFDEIRYEYYRDRQVAFEAFKAGNFTYREEFTARIWATGYDFPAVRDGRIKREELEDGTPSGMQGWFFNLRRKKFADPRIREAISLAFDFEATNRNVMYGAYLRTASYFENSPFRAQGKPGPEELALLDPLRGKVPDEVFGEPYVPPKSDGSGQDRTLLRRANTMLTEAGCKREGSVLKLPSGEALTFEFLDYDSILQPHTLPFIANLGLLGIQATTRIVDASQYQRRIEAFDFDLAIRRYSHSATPGESLRLIFGSRTANVGGSPNLAGFSDPAIDALVEKIVSAPTRPELTAACRALDRVLRAGLYWVPMWYRGKHPLAYWDMYGYPPPPRYGLPMPAAWWWDADKARRIGRQ